MLIKQRRRNFRLRTPWTLEFVYVWKKGVGLSARRPFKKGDIVLKFDADIVALTKATPEAVTLDAKRALDTKWLVPEAFVNHSCEANTRIDVEKFQYVAVRHIKKGEEITYNYLTTEYDLVKTDGEFHCNCGSRLCVRRIRGFRYLSHGAQMKLKPYLTPFLRSHLDD